MANPQKENGYTAIANEIMEALAKIRIPGECYQILNVILRKTYGFNKKDDRISNSQFVSLTGINKNNVCRAINKLIEMNIVIKKDNSITSCYCFNKDFESWKLLSKKITVIKKDKAVIKKDNAVIKKDNAVIKKDNDCYQKRDIQKQKVDITKVDITKVKSKKIFDDSSIEICLSKLLFSLIKSRNNGHKQPDLQKWAYQIDLMIRKDKRDPDNIDRVIRWCQADNIPNKKGFCWANNILSTSSLREHYDQLFLKMAGNKEPKWKSGLEEWFRIKSNKNAITG